MPTAPILPFIPATTRGPGVFERLRWLRRQIMIL